MTNPNDPAFGNPERYSGTDLQFIGLTKREYYAGLAMQGTCSSTTTLAMIKQVCGDMDADEAVAKWSIAKADALIAELSKSK